MTPQELYELEDYENTFERVFCHRVKWKDDCWQWTGTWAGSGNEPYGQIKVDGKFIAAHRFAYLFFVGPIAPKMHIHHLCEYTLCVNPQHLQQIDPKTHVRGHVFKARAARWQDIGKRCDYSVLTDRQLEILNLCGDGLPDNVIAQKLGLSIKTIEFHKTRIHKLSLMNVSVNA